MHPDAPQSIPRQSLDLIDNLQTAVLECDGDLKIAYANPAAEALLATSASKLIGRRLEYGLPQSAGLCTRLRAALSAGQPFVEHEIEFRLPGHDATRVDCRATPLIEPERRSLLLELLPVNGLLRLSREDTREDRHAQARALLRGLAHEIKNPLGGLRGAAQLLDKDLSDPALKDYTRVIIHEADRLRALVDRMLDADRAPRLRAVNIHKLFEHVRKLLTAEMPVGLTVERDYDPSIPEFAADEDQLTQAILNIARNAAQAMRGHGHIRFRSRIQRQINLGNRRHRLALVAEIEDDGPGIPEDIRPLLFTPLVTGRAEGTGLGLAIAEGAIRAHGGTVDVESRPGRTCFRLLLPLPPAAPVT